MAKKLSFIFNSAQGLMLAANYLLDHMEDEGARRNPVKYAFILTASASLESMLNDGIVSWAHNSFPRADYKRHATAFLTMSLRGKLDVIGFLISKGARVTDNTSGVYQDLSNLIKLRNEVAHGKDFFTEVEVEVTVDEEGNEAYEFPSEVEKKLLDHGMPLIASNQEYLKTYKALELLYKVLNHELGCGEAELFRAV